MASYTRYLTTTAKAVNEFTVQISDSSPIAIAQDAIRNSCEVKYSPIMPAILTPQEGPPPVPTKLESVALLFANSPYKTLGILKTHLFANERSGIYFTEGLASIIFLNFTIKRTKQLHKIGGGCPLEYWPLKDGKLDARRIIFELLPSKQAGAPNDIILPSTDNAELKVYVEQISSSLQSLWASYGIYFPDERDTLRQIVILADNLVQQHGRLQGGVGRTDGGIACQKKANAIISALVEISAALSYAVTQGTTGSLPVLSNRSPFPHHSLLGIGGAVRALTKYTRYLESAFMARSAGKVISAQYSRVKQIVPASIPAYNSGPEYKFTDSPGSPDEHFDRGGNSYQEDQVPLIAHFSLRYGFMESKFSVTAASQALTAETLPQWTLMTLSHEIMHSRVRTIFQALFGKTWEKDDNNLISKSQFKEFCAWIQARKNPRKVRVVTSLRNVILNFCCAVEQCQHPIPANKRRPGLPLSMDKVNELYSRHKHLAIEILVHFHDYYFVYACQPKMYMMSLWASWIKVAAPYARTPEYLMRSLATVACGSGLNSIAAFDHAKEILLDGLASLEGVGIRSPLFSELRRLTSTVAESAARADFQPCYYLIDTVRRFFASRTIASKIDRLDCDPFAEGSTFVDDYTANIYVFGEGQTLSPIRYSLATLFKTLSGRLPFDDPQWLTAWNYMVISS